MADFNPTPGPADVPNFLNNSKGVDRPTPNRTFEALFEGVGNTLKVSAAAQEETQQAQIQNDIYQSYDKVTDEVALAQLQRDKAGANNFWQTQNPAVDTAVSNLERLNAARAAGKVSDVYYWSQLNTTTKSLRAKYPGQREYIDQQISRITGGTPANQLRNELNQEAQQAASRAEAGRGRDESFVRQNLGLVPPDLLKSYQQGDPNAIVQIENVVGQRKAQEESLKARKADLEYNASLGQANEQEAMSIATDTLNVSMNRFISDTSEKAGFGAFRDRITAQVASGKAPTPEQQQEFLSTFALLEAQARQVAQQALFQPNDRGKSLSSYLPPDKAKALQEQAMFPITQIKDMILNNQYGLVNQTVNMAKASQDARVAKLVNDNAPLQAISDFQKIGGDSLSQLALSANGNALLSGAMQAVIQSQAVRTTTAGSASLNEYHDQIKALDPKDTKAFQASIAGHVDMLMDKNTRPDVALNIAESMFGSKNTPFITRFRTTDDKLAVFSKMSSPEVTKKMQELGQANPAVWANYTNWSKQVFVATFGSAIDGTKEGQAMMPYTEVKFDPKTAQFSWGLTPQGREAQKGVKGFLGGNMVSNWNNAALEQSVKQLNQGISLIKPILEAEGSDPAVAITDLIKQKGLDTTKSTQDSFWSKLYRSVAGAGDAVGKNLDKPGTGGSPFDAFLGAWQARPAAEQERQLLDTIAGPESGGNYNAVSGNGKNAQPLDRLSVGDVKQLQAYMVQNKGTFPSSAVGRYQIIQGTLNELLKENDIGDDTLFTPELQDELARKLLERRGLNEYRSGAIDKATFGKRLAQEWAGLPLPSGKSYYDGDGLNRTTMAYDDFLNSWE